MCPLRLVILLQRQPNSYKYRKLEFFLVVLNRINMKILQFCLLFVFISMIFGEEEEVNEGYL